MITLSDPLSDLSGSVLAMPFHPWRAIRAMSLIVEWNRLDGDLGTWCERTRRMTLDPDMNQAERRCTAWHEAIHARRGDTSCDPSVHREAARDLISLHDLAVAVMVHGEDWPRVADDLWVDDDTLAVRLDSLHPSERGYLLRRLSMKESTA